jgi:ketosteroid isomerase-like protein
MRVLAGTVMCVALVGAGLALSVRSSTAHPPAKLTLEQEKGVIEEVIAFRKSLADAVKSKDARKLRALYADSFRHTQASGAIDTKEAYIAALLAGLPVIETAAVTELDIRIPGGWTAVATAKSALPSNAGGTPLEVRWMSVFVRKGDSWQVAGSQVTRVGGATP